MGTAEAELKRLIDFNQATLASRTLEASAMELVEKLDWQEVREIFRRISANEIETGAFLRRFSEATTAADLENFAVLLPNCYKLLAKYPMLLERHRATAPLTEFPPAE